MRGRGGGGGGEHRWTIVEQKSRHEHSRDHRSFDLQFMHQSFFSLLNVHVFFSAPLWSTNAPSPFPLMHAHLLFEDTLESGAISHFSLEG